MDIPLPATHEKGRFHIFMQIAMFLAVVTGLEIVIIFIPVSDFVQYTVLAVLSAVKFLAVILYFMHLRWDNLFCTVLFFIGLLLGGGTLGALILLFAEDRTSATADAVTSAPAALESSTSG